MKRLNLALRLLWRDGRSGELTILLAALMIAVSCSTAISLFSDRLEKTMNNQAAEFLAADLVIASPAPVSADWLAQAKQLKQAQAVEFPSVLIEHEELLLASVKAVSALYPLRGHLKVTNNEDLTTGSPLRTASPEFTPQQQQIETIAEDLLAQLGSPVNVELINAVIKAAKNPDDLEERLAALMVGSSSDVFTQTLEKALFIADVLGYVHAGS